MKSCTFIGHRNTPQRIEPFLEAVLIDLITVKNVKNFYVGTHGNFDFLVQKILKKLSVRFPEINYSIVFAYIPERKKNYCDYSHTVYPEDIEKTPKKYAIIERNKWMIKRCDYLVCYIEHQFSNAYYFKQYAERKEKKIINLFPTNDISQ